MTYFDNSGIQRNLPLNPINRRLRNTTYITIALAAFGIVGYIITQIRLVEANRTLKTLLSREQKSDELETTPNQTIDKISNSHQTS